MSLRHDLADVLARDPRYTIDAYAFVFESLEHAKSLKKREMILARHRNKATLHSRHVNGRELCEGVRQLAIQHFGYMALTVLKYWGICSTQDVGEIVFNLIDSGDLKKTPSDSRSDFLDVFDLEQALRREFVVTFDDVA